ncbi:hypothetical protein NQZ68_016773 [Dissostichus eleginoides]|nr:hypothetical protein NQZ68_016773 [Dissostichus eleginoides]
MAPSVLLSAGNRWTEIGRAATKTRENHPGDAFDGFRRMGDNRERTPPPIPYAFLILTSSPSSNYHPSIHPVCTRSRAIPGCLACLARGTSESAAGVWGS